MNGLKPVEVNSPMQRIMTITIIKALNAARPKPIGFKLLPKEAKEMLFIRGIKEMIMAAMKTTRT